MLVGVVSDTHGYVDDRLRAALVGVDAILHAGDVGGSHVLEELQSLAPVHAVRGNNDVKLGGLDLPDQLDAQLGGARLHVVHELSRANPGPATRVVVFGHSHQPLIDWRDGVLYLNPGAAGRRGFHTLQTAALLRIDGAALHPTLLTLGPRQQLATARPDRGRSISARSR